MNYWSHWGSCSVSCGSGRQKRSRSIKVYPFESSSCPSAVEYRKCTIRQTNCVVSSWSTWAACTKSCGAGTQTRTRSITVRPKNCGASCPSLVDRRGCTGHQCPKPCLISSWGAWSKCSVTCGSGTASRTRTIVTTPAYGGKPCSGLSDHKRCTITQQNCVVSPWGSWSPCSGSCPNGRKTRLRRVTLKPTGCGTRCPVLSQSSSCMPSNCVEDCAVTSWSGWSSCSVSCGSGKVSRYRKVVVEPAYGGKQCPGLKEHKSCVNTPNNCHVSQWSAWGTCTGTCPNGSQSRTRQIIVEPSNCGTSCPITAQAHHCIPLVCVTDCEVSSWSAWTTCSASCGSGRTSRSRTITQASEHGGKSCPGLHEHKTCVTSPVHCTVSSWTPWGSCSTTCGQGSHSRTRTIVQGPQACGNHCPSLVDSKSCANKKCEPICMLSPWGSWSTCSCAGTKTRSRTIVEKQEGAECLSLKEEVGCKDKDCKVDCQMSGWETWSKCSTFCGAGTQSRIRSVDTAPSGGGKACPAAKETRDCMPPCATDCEWNFWSKYGKCGCKSKEQLRHRTVKQPSLFGGKSCDGAEEDSIPCKDPSKKCKNKKKKCGKKKFACKAGSSCIRNALVCNGDADCGDSSDESKCKKVKLTCGKETYPLLPNIQLVGGAFDISTLARSSEVLDNSLFNGVCNNVYSPDHKKHFRKPYNVASFSYQTKATGSFVAKSFDSEKSVIEAIQESFRNMQDYADSSAELTQMSQLVGHAAGGDNAKLEKMIKDGYSDDYKYFSVKTVITVALFQMRDDKLLLNGDFEEDLNELHSWYDKVEYLRLLEKYGTHYYTEGTLGGQYKFIYKFRKADLAKADLTDTEQRQCLEDDAKIKLLGADVDINDRCNFNSKSFTNNAVQSVSFVDGGEANAVSSLSVNSDEKSLTEWTNSVIMHPAIVEYKIAPLSQLIDSRIVQGKAKKANMEAALLHFMKKFEPIRCNSFNAGVKRCRNGAKQKVVKDGRECVCLCPAGLYGAGCEVPA
ncbi:uncharacterized protein LOC100187002 [Ciona intestinalis]